MFSTATITPGLDADGMSRDERDRFDMLEANRALGLIMQRVPLGTRLGNCTIRTGRIEILIAGEPTDHAKRAAVMGLAEQFGFEFTEQDHGNGRNIVTAKGFYHGIPVKFWQLVNSCGCGCGGAR